MKKAIVFIIIFGWLWFVTERDNKALEEDKPYIIEMEKSAPPKALSFKLSKNEMDCLAQAVYFEARDQTIEGQVMVSFVVLNRMKSKRFPDSVCKVVKQGYRPGKRNCHFSWFCDSLPEIINDKKSWNVAYQIAVWTVDKYDTQEQFYTESSDHYHTNYIKSPWWTKKMIRVKQVGNHIFYTS